MDQSSGLCRNQQQSDLISQPAHSIFQTGDVDKSDEKKPIDIYVLTSGLPKSSFHLIN